MQYEVDGICFLTDGPMCLRKREMASLAAAYRRHRKSIMAHLCQGLAGYYPGLDPVSLPGRLGKPLMDARAWSVSYVGHDLDNGHVITFEFADGFRKLGRVYVDG